MELAVKVGMVVGRDYANVVVGRDTRTSGDAIKHAFISGLLTAGCQGYDAGIVPTPTLALSARDFDAGTVITASHNPPEYNGIKLWNRDGSAFDAEQRKRVEDEILGNTPLPISWQAIKSSNTIDDAVEKHTDHILKDVSGVYNIRVVLDCGCGAASVITPYLLRRLGCDVVTLNCYPSGFFPHAIEPTDANLTDLKQAVKEFGADLGIAHDGDADRMMAVDNRGRFIPGDKLLVLFARQANAREVITTIDASMVVDEMGFTVTRTPVGDAYVSEEIKKGGDFGGEPTGSWIFPRNLLCPDGIYAAARLVAITSQQDLTELVDDIPDYPIIRGSIDNEGVELLDLKEYLLSLKPLSVNDSDGIRLSFEDGWLLIRVSGTEPKIRITAEARSSRQVHQLYDGSIKIIEKYIGETKE